MVDDNKLDKQVKKHALTPEMIEKQWKPGQSGNPNGRPTKDVCITSLIKEFLEKEADGSKTHAQLVAEAIVKLAEDHHFKGNVSAIKELLDRIEGKVPETHNIKSDIPVIIQPVVYERCDDAIQRQDKGQGSTQGADEEEA